MRKRGNIFVAYFCVFALSLVACANIVVPSGGPADMKPPVYVSSKPDNHSVNFAANKIEIRFNEFINLEDPTGQIIFSPPLEKFPDIKTKNKGLVIHFEAPLAENTSYNVTFGNSIKDITEGNILNNFRFIFSTGSIIDSFSLRGNVIDAFSLGPEKDILVLLHKRAYDSVPFKEIPLYIAKTDNLGLFEFTNVAPGYYRIFAVKDINGNMKFDAGEKIAFSDSLAVAQYVPRPDTTSQGNQAKDTLKPFIRKNYSLFLFEEADTAQRLLKAKADHPGQLKLFFKWPVKDLQLRFIKNPQPSGWCINEFSQMKDSLTCWIPDLTIDSLYLQVSDGGLILDTLRIELKDVADTLKKPGNKSGKGVSDKDFPFKLLMMPNATSQKNFDLNEKLRIEFLHPLAEVDLSKVTVLEKKDSIGKAITLKAAFTDSLIKRKLEMEYPWKGKMRYELVIEAGAFTDIYGLQNDSLRVKFMTTDLEDYGILKLNLVVSEDKPPFLLQLLNDKKEVIREARLSKQGRIEFDFLRGGTYSARIIIDRNDNGRWDSGRYLQNIQPEKIYNYPGTINIKANWDTEIDWNL